MGIVSTSLSQSNNMKFLLVLAVAAYARAEAEANPGFVYTVGHHAPLVYNTLPYAYHHPVVYTAPVGCQNDQGAAVPCAHGVLPYGLVAAAPAPAAADAEADPEADPWLYYHGLGYAAHPYGYGYHGLGYAAYAGYHPYAYYGGCRNGYGALVPCA